VCLWEIGCWVGELARLSATMI